MIVHFRYAWKFVVVMHQGGTCYKHGLGLFELFIVMWLHLSDD